MTTWTERLGDPKQTVERWAQERQRQLQDARTRLEQEQDALARRVRGRIDEGLSEVVAQRDAWAQRAAQTLDAGRGAVITAEARALSEARRALHQAGDVLVGKPFLGWSADALQRSTAKLAEAERTLRASHPKALPIADYESLSVAALKPLLAGLDADGRAVVARWEAAHKNRVTVLRELERLGRV